MNSKINLAGEWEFCLDSEKKGIGEHFENAGYGDTIMLPGSVSFAKKGKANRSRETGFLTDVFRFEGYAWYRKTIRLPFGSESELKGKHFFLTLERSRITTVWVDGKLVGSRNSFIAKQIYDLTGFITGLSTAITVMVSNVDYIAPGGHMTSPDTQTNWNGILGEISLEISEKARIEHAEVRSELDKKSAVINTSLEAFEEADIKVEAVTDLCILKKEYLKEDADISAWEERAIKEQPAETDPELLESYLDIKKDAVCPVTFDTTLEAGVTAAQLKIVFPEDAKLWDEEEPYLYRITLYLKDSSGEVLSKKVLWFGLRSFTAEGDHFYINGRKTFLRGRHQGLLFPLSGFAPMNVTGWLKDLKIAKDWGFNQERCHTCTPPEAAFIAADLLGIYLQPEIPFWGTWHGEEDEEYEGVKEAQEFLREEGFNILREFAGHPSFVMMSLGNELWGNTEALDKLLAGYKNIRPDILFTQGSNNFQWSPQILPHDDFFAGVRFTKERQIRGSYAQCDAPLGRIQKSKPSTNWNYDDAIKPARKETTEGRESASGTVNIQYGTGVKRVKLSDVSGELVPEIPVISHEIGQYFIYPDYNEITEYKGVCQARNLEIFQERLEDVSLSARAEGYFESSGALAMDCYKLELEAALRSKNLAGFQMLDLQDYSGQGTALVGPLNALMKNKGLISPKDWRSFCSSAVVLGEFDSFVVTAGDHFTLKVKLAYYRKKPLKKVKLKVALFDADAGKLVSEAQKDVEIPEETGLFTLAEFETKVPDDNEMERYDLSLSVWDGEDIIAENRYRLWAYEKAEKLKADTDIFVVEDEGGEEVSFEVTTSGNVAITTDWVETDAAIDTGRSVLFYLNPSENRSLPGAYCTDFWNYPMFKSISESMGKPIPVGTLGTLIAKDHPALAHFKTESYSTPQWYEIIERSRSSLLNWLGFRPIVTVIDNCESNDNLGIIYEFMIMDGKNGPSHVLVCTSPLRKLAQEGNAPAAALERSLLEYLEGESAEDILRTHTQQLRRLAY